MTRKSVHGFTILLNKPAPGDIGFSWTAFAVKSAKLFTSRDETVTSTTTEPIKQAEDLPDVHDYSITESFHMNPTSTPALPTEPPPEVATSTPEPTSTQPVAQEPETPAENTPTTTPEPPPLAPAPEAIREPSAEIAP